MDWTVRVSGLAFEVRDHAACNVMQRISWSIEMIGSKVWSFVFASSFFF